MQGKTAAAPNRPAKGHSPQLLLFSTLTTKATGSEPRQPLLELLPPPPVLQRTQRASRRRLSRPLLLAARLSLLLPRPRQPLVPGLRPLSSHFLQSPQPNHTRTTRDTMPVLPRPQHVLPPGWRSLKLPSVRSTTHGTRVTTPAKLLPLPLTPLPPPPTPMRSVLSHRHRCLLLLQVSRARHLLWSVTPSRPSGE